MKMGALGSGMVAQGLSPGNVRSVGDGVLNISFKTVQPVNGHGL